MLKYIRKLNGLKVICLIAALVCTVLLTDAFLGRIRENTEHTKNSSNYTPFEESSQENHTLQTEKTKIYTVKEYKGIIGVFEDAEAQPCMTEPTQVKLLPPEDKKLISEGVTFNTYKELINFLQNYE